MSSVSGRSRDFSSTFSHGYMERQLAAKRLVRNSPVLLIVRCDWLAVLGAMTDTSAQQHRTAVNRTCSTDDHINLSALADSQHVLILHHLISSYRPPLV